ncbi:MAG: type II toxin-antitoxin system HicB family antitoxin [Erysipelotrichaceae bacterium]|nr:type II toxin-antitoxin system HicB family antitoxin [Erysipelotrichaceae bacterium]
MLYGKIIGLRKSSITYEGVSLKELKQDFEDAVDDYISSFSDPEEIEKPCKGVFNVRIGPELHVKAVIKARERNQTLNAFVKEAIERQITG